MTSETINSIFGISESFELPEKLMNILLSGQEQKCFEQFLILRPDLSKDWFTDYFQESHSNREKMMQDFTPHELSGLLPEMAGEFHIVQDICAGTGGLTIAAWTKNPDAVFVCEELSSRAVPLLLFNLAVRNMNAWVLHEDVLEQDIKAVYRIVPGERFGRVEHAETVPDLRPDLVITNPPYSVKWKHDLKNDTRFDGYGYPPPGFSDYAFILHGLYRLQDGGRLFAILPHGVLFRGRQEEAIRSALVRSGLLRAVIGLPEKLFLNTNIPVCVLSIEKTKRTPGVLFIDASREFKAEGKQNRLAEQHIKKILFCWETRTAIEKFSHNAGLQELEANGFNLNIPRYVDTFEREPLPDPAVLMRELKDLNLEIIDTEKELLKMLKMLTGEDPKTVTELGDITNSIQSLFEEGENGQLFFSLPARPPA